MHYPDASELKSGLLNKISFSIHAAASLIYLLRKQRDAVGLSVFSDDTEVHTPARSSPVHHKLLFFELEKILAGNVQQKKKKTFAPEALHRIAENIHKRSLVVIFSDMMDTRADKQKDLFAALQHLRYNKHEVMLFHVTDRKKEIDFEFDNRPYVFVDVETGEEVKAHYSEVKEHYRNAAAAYNKELLLKCGQYRIDFIEADIRQGYRQVLLPYLIKRERMG
jgi:uncharacterized protein (DUF58 family)